MSNKAIDSYIESGVTIKDRLYDCGVYHCGGEDGCVHSVTSKVCPRCGARIVIVTETGYMFCESTVCEYEELKGD